MKSPSKRTNYFKQCADLLLSLGTSALLTPLLITIALCVGFIRFVISLYLRLFYNRIRLIGSMDSFQVFDKPNNILETYTMVILSGVGNIDKIRRIVLSQVINNRHNLYEKLKCKVVKKFGFYCWANVGKDFDIRDHVKLVQNIKSINGNTVIETEEANHDSKQWCEKDVMGKISEFYKTGMPLEKPRWELWVIPNYILEEDEKNDDPHYAVIFRFHHSIIDGISIFLLISNALADTGQKLRTAIDPLKPLRIPLWVKIWDYIRLFCWWPKMMYEAIKVPPETNCFHGPSLSEKKVVCRTKPFRIETLRKIRALRKRKPFSTNAVLNAAVGGAFKKLAEAKGYPVPEEITAVTSIPMLPYPNLKPQNRFSGAFFPLKVAGNKTDVEVGFTKLERIEATDKTIQEIVDSPLVLLNSLLLRFIGILPGSLSQNMTDSRELTCLTSNIPGPLQQACLFEGDRILDVAGFLPIKNKTGFGICFTSYCGNIRASIVGDAAVAPERDIEILKEALESEIQEMASKK